MRRVHLARSYRNAVMALGPVGYWRLGEASGTVARDETSANDGTYVGAPTLGASGALAGDSNTGVSLSGTGQYVTVSDARLPAGAAPRTIVSWGYRTAGANRVVLRYGTYSGVASVLFYIDNSTTRLALYNRTTAVTAATQNISVGLHMYALSYDGANACFSVDGQPWTAPQAITLGTALYECRIGYSEVDGDAWVGLADETAVFPRPLAAAEIARLYAVGRGF